MLRPTRLFVIPVLAGLLSACSAFYIPDEDDDGVQRCDNVGECDIPANSRFDVECVFGEEQDESTKKVCAPKFREVSCDVDDYSGEHALVQKWETAQEVTGVYIACDSMNQLGERGCKPKPMGQPCNDASHVVNQFGVCDVADAEFPAAEASKDRQGLDVLDQFCRSYFCDKNWVCDASGAKPLCRPCGTANAEGNPGVGQGACAEIWTGGVKSTVYIPDGELSCGEDGLSSDPDTAARLAGEKIGEVPGS